MKPYLLYHHLSIGQPDPEDRVSWDRKGSTSFWLTQYFYIDERDQKYLLVEAEGTFYCSSAKNFTGPKKTIIIQEEQLLTHESEIARNWIKEYIRRKKIWTQNSN